MLVIKRDGTKQEFDKQRIEKAVVSASEACGQELVGISDIIDKIVNKIPKQESINVSDIESVVEHVLMVSKYKDTAKAYIEYRAKRDEVRENNGKLLADITSFLDQSSDEFTKENANKDSRVVNTHRDLLAGIVSKHYALSHILPKDVAQAHKEGFIHVHDLDYILSPLTNCSLVNYRDMLENGFKIGNASIEKPKSIGVATTVLTQIIQGVASSQYGGQTCTHIDSGLKCYVEASYNKNKDFIITNMTGVDDIESIALAMTEQNVYDAMQTLLYQVNTLMSVNGQSPFITISFGLDTSVFGRMITRNYLKVHMEGLGKDKVTPVFPKVVFFLDEGVNMNEDDPNYDLKQLALECSAKRIYPDFISVPLNHKITGSVEEAVTSMGCRSFLGKYINKEGKEQYDGRFNLGVVTTNLALIAKDSVARGKPFLDVLNDYLELCYDAHMVRVDRLKGVKARQNPMMFMEGAFARLSQDEDISKLFYDGYASISIGYGGVAEACEILYGSYEKDDGLSILKAMKDKCKEFSDRSGLAFSLYGTPLESTCYKFAKCVNDKYPGTLERDYVTNSFHQPVWVESSPFDKWLFEEGFAELSSGGNIGYVETPNLKHNLKALESLVDFGYNRIHYFGVNQPVDACFKCGYTGEFTAKDEGFCCPSCGNHEEGTISVIRRVSGYLSAPNARPFNKGKMHETMERVKHQ